MPLGALFEVDANLLGDPPRRFVADANEAHEPRNSKGLERVVANDRRRLGGESPVPLIAPQVVPELGPDVHLLEPAIADHRARVLEHDCEEPVAVHRLVLEVPSDPRIHFRRTEWR